MEDDVHPSAAGHVDDDEQELERGGKLWIRYALQDEKKDEMYPCQTVQKPGLDNQHQQRAEVGSSAAYHGDDLLVVHAVSCCFSIVCV